jgi:spore germination protein YaaH
LLIIHTGSVFAAENIFYVLRYKSPDRMSSPNDTLASLKKNYKKINILIPQAYSITESGTVEKGIEPEILQFAEQQAMKIMPLVTNAKFSSDVAHQFLSNSVAQSNALKTLIDICKKNHFYGIQFDFEMVNIKDRDALTHFYELAANELHKNNLQISFAVAPVVTDKPTTLFLKKIYANWEGAYDLKALGNVADFVSIMAYNQHGGPTTPGSTADLPWVDQTIKYALQYIPSNKISIGLPDYSSYWYTGSIKVNNDEKVSMQMQPLNYEKATMLAQKNKKKFIWDNEAGSYYTIFSNNWLNEYLFLENYKSFDAKYSLVKKYHLRGISIFDLGTEDPRIWSVL